MKNIIIKGVKISIVLLEILIAVASIPFKVADGICKIADIAMEQPKRKRRSN